MPVSFFMTAPAVALVLSPSLTTAVSFARMAITPALQFRRPVRTVNHLHAVDELFALESL